MAKFKTRRGLLDYLPPPGDSSLLSVGAPLVLGIKGVGGKAPAPRKVRGKTRKEVEIQGGALSGKLTDQDVGKILDEHGMEWDYHDNGGVTAIEYYTQGGRLKSQRKHFRPGTSIRTLRNWLNY